MVIWLDEKAAILKKSMYRKSHLWGRLFNCLLQWNLRSFNSRETRRNLNCLKSVSRSDSNLVIQIIITSHCLIIFTQEMLKQRELTELQTMMCKIPFKLASKWEERNVINKVSIHKYLLIFSGELQTSNFHVKPTGSSRINVIRWHKSKGGENFLNFCKDQLGFTNQLFEAGNRFELWLYTVLLYFQKILAMPNV